MYCGETHSKIDDKGRLNFSSTFKTIMEVKDHYTWYITRGYDNCLFLFEKIRWEKLITEEIPQATLDPRKMDLRRFLVGGSVKLNVDKQFRILLPEHLREYAGIDRDVAILGLEDHIQIWSSTRWNEYFERNASTYKQLAAEEFGMNASKAAEPMEEN